MDSLNHGRPLPPIKTRWKKGQSGNLRGRPKKKDSLTELLEEELAKVCPTDPERRSFAQLFIRTQVQQALRGSGTASKEIWKRGDRIDERTNTDQASMSRPERMKEVVRFICRAYGLNPEALESRKNNGVEPETDDNSED